MNDKRKLIVQCFECSKDIYEGDQLINKSINKNKSRGFFSFSQNDSTTYENMIICKSCVNEEIEIYDDEDKEYSSSLLIILLSILCYSFWYEIYKKVSYESKFKCSIWITFISILIILFFSYLDKKKSKFEDFLREN